MCKVEVQRYVTPKYIELGFLTGVLDRLVITHNCFCCTLLRIKRLKEFVNEKALIRDF